MAYGPHTSEDRASMLAAIGVASVDDLFADIPPSLRASGLELPEPES
jgi:glycine dehydrogenase subunit 1